ncbi:MAG: RNase adapter RapZ [Actinobacteria bacterium]|nr:RNase adapter RapZ [Actinomycetota bacterium]
MNEVEFTIITGLSGAGKSETMKCFEDMEYFCIDNLPPTLIGKVADLCSVPGSHVKKVALGVDVRGGAFFDDLFEALDDLKRRGIPYQILFLEASDIALVKRFKETRRRHPLSEEGQVIDGINLERKIMEPLRDQADMVIDTGELEAFELKDKIRSMFLGSDKQKGLLISVISFGYKYGVPIYADLVMDVRFLPNPHYIDELKEHDGTEKDVRSFVLDRKETATFMKKFLNLLTFLLPHYISEGKTHLAIAIGCTGGTHRSVALAEESAKFLADKGYAVTTRHRDVGRSTRKG